MCASLKTDGNEQAARAVVQEAPGAGVVAHYAEAAAHLQVQHPGPKWLAERRRDAFEHFRTHGIPTPSLEAWRRTDLRSVRNEPYTVAPATPQDADDVDETDVTPLRLADAAAELVFVDGVHAPHLDRVPDLPGGVKVTTLATLLDADPACLEPHLARLAPHRQPEHALTALNTALFIDGAYVEVPKGTIVRAPIHLLFLTTGTTPKRAAFPRVLIEAMEASECTVVETHAGLPGATAAAFNAAVTEATVGPAAVLRRVKVQREAPATTHVGTSVFDAARDAQVHDLSFSLGAGRSRHDVRASLADEGASVTLNGLFLGAAKQHVDHFTHVDHAVPHTTSVENYKGILAGAAHGVFTGNVLVRPGAQQTNSFQENRNLILSDKALVDTTPQLEIFADDVKCSHGSTIGQLDESSLYYLRSRGFPLALARRTLTEAFATEVLSGVRHEPLRKALEGQVRAWFDGEADARDAEAEVPA